MKTNFWLTALLVTALGCSASRADILIDVLVPAYANPCCGGGPSMWTSLIAAAGNPNRNYGVHAIFNPASGPGTGRDPNYLNDVGVGPLSDFRNAGGISYGYVATGFASRSINDVIADVDAYLAGHYAGYVDGIFFDEMSNDLANVGYYQQLQAYVQSRQSGARTIGNPGTTFVSNPSGQATFAATDFVNALDTVMTFEGTGTDYVNNYTSFSHLEGLDRLKLAHVVHSQGVWETSILDLASQRGSGFLYVTDDVFLDPDRDNPYDSLTSTWAQFLADVQEHNATVVPEPRAAWLVGAIVVQACAQCRRRRMV